VTTILPVVIHYRISLAVSIPAGNLISTLFAPFWSGGVSALMGRLAGSSRLRGAVWSSA
jgi:hypothetical protein